MEIEERQAPFIEKFVEEASAVVDGPALTRIVVESTSHPSVFAFSEISAVPNFDKLQGTADSAYIDLLELFAYGIWRDYKAKSSVLPQLTPGQIIKLKQLTVLTLAKESKDISYDTLLDELEFSSIRELEDFLIDECVYAGIIKGDINQLSRCFQVQFAAGRDLLPSELESATETTRIWLETSDNLLALIEKQIDMANAMEQLEKKRDVDVKVQIENAKKNINFRDHDVGNSNKFNEDLLRRDGFANFKKGAKAKRGRNIPCRSPRR
ncbi:COP9 signalosome complex subunit 7 [Linum grandiflorum]